MRYAWGVDSAQTVTKETYTSVVKQYGKPNFWGRSLSTVPSTSEGLTTYEIEWLHDHGIKILPFYNSFQKATGLRQGKVVAQNAVFHARRLDVPKGKVLFAYVEDDMNVDEAWIRGYVEGMYSTGYLSGFYCDPIKGNFTEAYCKAVSKDQRVLNQSILLSAQPKHGTTRARKAPKYKPTKPTCKANVWGWQYGMDRDNGLIGTNLVDERLYGLLW